MADVAQSVRALDCGSGGRGFDPHHSPQINSPTIVGLLIWDKEPNLRLRPRVRSDHRHSARKSAERALLVTRSFGVAERDRPHRQIASPFCGAFDLCVWIIASRLWLLKTATTWWDIERWSRCLHSTFGVISLSSRPDYIDVCFWLVFCFYP